MSDSTMTSFDKWDFRFLNLAREISTWSKDPSTKIGAIIVADDRRILGTGYNGFPMGVEDCDARLSDRTEKYPRIIHAEMNALLNCLRSGVSVMNSNLYIYGLPMCAECTKSVIQSGVKNVVMAHPALISDKWTESMVLSREMLTESGVMFRIIDIERCHVQ